MALCNVGFCVRSLIADDMSVEWGDNCNLVYAPLVWVMYGRKLLPCCSAPAFFGLPYCYDI